jgi:hypothetical protein
MNKRLLGLMGLSIINSHADNLQSNLMSIAAQEAQISNIGANKAMMLYGIGNPITVINRWNQIEQRSALSDEQIRQINVLEAQKQQMLQQITK